MCKLLKTFSGTLGALFSKSVQHFTTLKGSVPSHYLTHTSSRFPTPASINNKPTHTCSFSQNNLENSKMSEWRAGRQAGSTALKMKGNLCLAATQSRRPPRGEPMSSVSAKSQCVEVVIKELNKKGLRPALST